MSQIPVKEQFVVHALKAFTSGEITNPLEIQGVKPRASAGNLAPSGQHGDRVPRPGTPDGLTVYTDPEDIPFGKPKVVYALAWTHDKARKFKTKAGKKKPWESVEPKLRAWKRWYERQGWTIYGAATGGWHIAKSPNPRVVHNKREPFDIYIGRPSKWGNPFSHKEGTRAEFKVETRQQAIDAYAEWIQTQPELLADLHELRGKTLGCWCSPLPCHGDVLSELAGSTLHAAIIREYDQQTKKRL